MESWLALLRLRGKVPWKQIWMSSSFRFRIGRPVPSLKFRKRHLLLRAESSSAIVAIPTTSPTDYGWVASIERCWSSLGCESSRTSQALLAGAPDFGRHPLKFLVLTVLTEFRLDFNSAMMTGKVSYGTVMFCTYLETLPENR